MFDEQKVLFDIKKDGYAVVKFLTDQEIIDIQDFYHSLSHDFTSGFAATIINKDIHYRQFINSGIKKILAKKMAVFFESYRLCNWNFVVKGAQRLDSAVILHHDWTFVDPDRFNSLVVWSPLVDVDNSNGCLKVVKGSHNLNNKPWGASGGFGYDHLLPIIEKGYLTELPIKAGEAVIFDNRLFHCSPPNQTTNERVAIAGLMIPIDSTLRYYYYDPEKDPSKYEVFEVNDEFYTSSVWGVRPEGLNSLGFVNREFDPITIDDFVNKIDKNRNQHWNFLKWIKGFIPKSFG